MKLNHYKILILAALAAPGCTRKAEKRDLTDATVILAPATVDTKVPLKPAPPPIRLFQTSLAFSNQRFNTVDFFRLVENIHGLATTTKDAQLGVVARGMYESFYKNESNYTHTTFLTSLLPPAILGEGEPVIRQETTAMEKDLRDTVPKMSALLAGSIRGFPWPKKLDNLMLAVGVVDNYMAWLRQQVPNLDISSGMKTKTLGALDKEYTEFRPKLESLVRGLLQSRKLAQALAAVKKAVTDLGVNLKPEQAEKIRQADELAEQIAQVEEPQDALTMLVMLWQMSDAEERVAIKQVSQKMYDFFETKSDSQLECLAKRHCMNPILGISKLVIFKQLNEYGLEKMAREIDVGTRNSIVTSATKQITLILPQIPVAVNDKVKESAKKFLDLIKSIQRDIPGFMRSHLNTWASTKFNEPIRGLEVPEVNVTMAGHGQISVNAVAPAANVLRTGAANLGSSLALAQTFLPEEDQGGLKALLAAPLLKLLAIGGFRISDTALYPSFLFALDGNPGDLFDLKKMMEGKTTFAVPDSFVANRSFQIDRKNAPRNAGVGPQAELLRGIARQIRFHRDWERNQFDTGLGVIQMEELVPEFPQGTVNSSLFPKDIVFAMALGNAGAMLRNMIQELSPAFLILEKGEILWGNQYQEIRGSKVSTIAALVSIEDGKRGNTVRTAEIARYVLALDEFMGATDGMEQTGSSILKAETDGGRSTLIRDLVEIRKKLLLLQMGLSNYLVHVAQLPGGGLGPTFTVNGGLQPVAGAKRLEDQALAIRALLASASRLELPLFRWTALDVFHNLNKNFFDEGKQFYLSEQRAQGTSVRPAMLHDIALMLQAGEELSTYMPEETRKQWERIAGPWVRALQEL